LQVTFHQFPDVRLARCVRFENRATDKIDSFEVAHKRTMEVYRVLAIILLHDSRLLATAPHGQVVQSQTNLSVIEQCNFVQAKEQ